MNLPEAINQDALHFTITKLGINPNQALKTIALLFIEDCTIPFIARYRKEATGNLDEVQIKSIKEHYEEYIELQKRRAYILDAITKMEKMTPELRKSIEKCESLSVLEDIYAPYKSKRKTKADIAKELGLEKISNYLLTSKEPLEKILPEVTTEFIETKKCKNIEEALQGAVDIITETFARDIEIKQQLKEDLSKNGLYSSELKKDGDKIKEYEKFKDYFEYEVKIKDLFEEKNSHRYLALRRGVTLKVLKLSMSSNIEYAQKLFANKYYPQSSQIHASDKLDEIAQKAYRVSIHTSLDLEIKSKLKKIADAAAINVFGQNLKDLLLSPYLGAKAVLGIDPGVRTGCKIVVIDSTGKLIGDHVIYPFAPKFDVQGSKLIIEKILESFDIKFIAIGNGTNGRETLQFINQNIQMVKDKKVKATMINEAGASIYSASDIAREEFPDKDVTVRGAVSIARRFQDPLAELVKIDPKSIGVGQYQHDVNQTKLKKELEATTESCVNYVGVDVNTASAPLLSFVSGIGPSVAKNIVKYREKNGPFKSREQFLKIPRFSEKIFEQAAGFLRIYNGEYPLDATFVHPERYNALRTWLKNKNKELFDNETIDYFASDKQIQESLGIHTHQDIVDSLKAPKQDPRSEFESVDFRDDVNSINDLKINEWYTGIVNNLTNFGAFIDLGIKESGLVHISQICDQFIESPSEKLKLGQKVKARVIEVDFERKRVALSLKNDDGTTDTSNKSKPKKKAQEPRPNNAFGALKNFKLK